MSELRDSWKRFAIRFAIALPLWLFCVFAIGRAGLIGLVIGVPAAILAGLICVPAFCEILAYPCGALFCPEKRFDRVPPPVQCRGVEGQQRPLRGSARGIREGTGGTPAGVHGVFSHAGHRGVPARGPGPR